MVKRQAVDIEFWTKLDREIEGDAAGDIFTRGRYATDASIYQGFPIGVACPKNEADLNIIIQKASQKGLSVTARGGGTSTAGQALGEGIVIDFSKYFNRVLDIDADGLRCLVEPGATLYDVERAVSEYDLSFPIDILSSRTATIGGSLANNSAGLRAIRHGGMSDNVDAVRCLLSDRKTINFETIREDGLDSESSRSQQTLLDLLSFAELHEKAIRDLYATSHPGLPFETYDLGSLLPSELSQNPVKILGGSEGTLGLFTKLELKLVRKTENRALGICRISKLQQALQMIPQIIEMGAATVEFLDHTLIEFLRVKAKTDPYVQRLLQGPPQALLFVEFDDENAVENTRRLKNLDYLLASSGQSPFSVVEIIGEKAQEQLWQLRKDAILSALSLNTASRPIALLQDAAVPISKLSTYFNTLDKIANHHNVRFIMWGNLGRGCVNIQPCLDLRQTQDQGRLSVIADEITELIAKLNGILTHGYGLGIARGQALEDLRGQRFTELLRQIKIILDSKGMMNPGKILDVPSFDEKAILKSSTQAQTPTALTGLMWNKTQTQQDVFDHANQCEGLSLCQSRSDHICPSYLISADEKDSPRGRANSIRLALGGKLGTNALNSAAMFDTFKTCTSCKACTVTCPFGIDIPKMKIEMLASIKQQGRGSRTERLYAHLPHYSNKARRFGPLLYIRDLMPSLARLSERHLGFDAHRPWPKWNTRQFKPPRSKGNHKNGVVALFADTFNRSFDTANMRAAARVLDAAGYKVIAFEEPATDRKKTTSLCCGRSFYDTGYVAEARKEAMRFAASLHRMYEEGIPVIGIEPVCTLMPRDDYASLDVSIHRNALPVTFEEFVSAKRKQGGFQLPFKTIEADLVLHSHCHEQSAQLTECARETLNAVPGLDIISAPRNCCGLNGLVGMTPETFETSLLMAEQTLFPAIRKAGRDAFISATGFSCRKQIQDGLGVVARHPAMILDLALRGDKEILS